MNSLSNAVFEHPLAVITSASSGIGYELAKVFAENEFDLIVAAEDAGIADSGNAFRQYGHSVDTVHADLSTFEGVERLVSKIRSSGRPVDSVAINAGFGVSGRFTETDLLRELSMIRLNVDSAVHLTKRLLPDMIADGHGRILFSSSVTTDLPAHYLAVYTATNAFIQSFSEAIRNEVKDTGVTVTAFQTGPTDTNFFERKESPIAVAREGFKAMMNGKNHVVAGNATLHESSDRL
jgi:short-subunit dehydrogenase